MESLVLSWSLRLLCSYCQYLRPILSLSCNLPVNVTSDLVLSHTHLSSTNFHKNVNRVGLYLTVWIVMSHHLRYDWKHQIYLFDIVKFGEVHHTFIIYLCHLYSRPILSPGSPEAEAKVQWNSRVGIKHRIRNWSTDKQRFNTTVVNRWDNWF